MIEWDAIWREESLPLIFIKKDIEMGMGSVLFDFLTEPRCTPHGQIAFPASVHMILKNLLFNLRQCLFLSQAKNVHLKSHLHFRRHLLSDNVGFIVGCVCEHMRMVSEVADYWNLHDVKIAVYI